MAYIKDIINRNFDDCINYKVTIIGEGTVIFEGFKKVLSFSPQEITIALCKATMQVTGEGLKIEVMERDYMQLGGRIISVSRIDS